MSNLFLGALADDAARRRTPKGRLQRWRVALCLSTLVALSLVLAICVGYAAEPGKMVDLVVHVRAPTMQDAHLTAITMAATNLATRSNCDDYAGDMTVLSLTTFTTISCRVVDEKAAWK